MGNPTAYLILKCLEQNSMTVSELSARLEINLTTISKTLRHLRNVDAVRYLTIGKERAYWIKNSKISASLLVIENWIDDMRVKIE